MNASALVPLLSTRTRTALGVFATLATFVLAREVAQAFGIARAGQLAVVAAVVLATWLLFRAGSSWAAVGLRRPPGIVRTVLLALGTYAATVVLLVALVRPLAALLGLPPQNIEAWDGLRGNLPSLGLALAMVWTTVAFGEELLFRGFLQRSLVSLLGPTTGAFVLAVVAQAVLFGVLHGYLGAAGMLTAGAVGLVFGFATRVTGGNLWPLVIAHGLIDTVSLVAIYAGATVG